MREFEVRGIPFACPTLGAAGEGRLGAPPGAGSVCRGDRTSASSVEPPVDPMNIPRGEDERCPPFSRTFTRKKGRVSGGFRLGDYPLDKIHPKPYIRRVGRDMA